MRGTCYLFLLLLPHHALAIARHVRFSSGYAWNVTSLSPSFINLAQTASVGSAALLAQRGIPSALAAFQSKLFERTHVLPGGSRLVDNWKSRLDALMTEAAPLVRRAQAQ